MGISQLTNMSNMLIASHAFSCSNRKEAFNCYAFLTNSSVVYCNTITTTCLYGNTQNNHYYLNQIKVNYSQSYLNNSLTKECSKQIADSFPFQLQDNTTTQICLPFNIVVVKSGNRFKSIHLKILVTIHLRCEIYDYVKTYSPKPVETWNEVKRSCKIHYISN